MTTVFVNGATGNTGLATVKALAKIPNVKIVAQIRDPKKAAEKLKDLNVTVVHNEVEVTKEGDVPHHSMMKVAEDMKKSGATSVFIVPPHDHRVAICGALARAAKHAGVKFIALISVSGAMIGPNAGIFATQMAEIELEIAKTKIPSCFLRLPFFMENYWGNVQSIKGQGQIYYPVKPDSKYSQISCSDIGEAAAVILSNYTKHQNKNYFLFGEITSASALAATYAKVLGKPCNFISVSSEQAAQAMSAFMPKWQIDGVIEIWNGIDAGTYPLGSETSDFKMLTGHEGQTFEQWLTPIAGAFK